MTAALPGAIHCWLSIHHAIRRGDGGFPPSIRGELGWKGGGKSSTRYGWKSPVLNIRWVEEILHHLGWLKPYK